MTRTAIVEAAIVPTGLAATEAEVRVAAVVPPGKQPDASLIV